MEFKSALLNEANRLKKRERTQNWNQEEKDKLLELCREHLAIIENKRYDAQNTEAKTRVWFLIHQDFSSQFGKERSVNRLKEQWRRMKAAARSEIQEYKNGLHSNMNVQKNKKPSAFCFKIWDLLNESKRICENNMLLSQDTVAELPLPERANETNVAGESIKRDIETEPKIKYRLKPFNEQIVNNTYMLDTVSPRPALENQQLEMIDSSASSTPNFEKSHKTDLEPHHEQGFTEVSDRPNYEAMLYKEHLMRMKILEAQQEHLARSTVLINLCTKAAQRCFADFL